MNQISKTQYGMKIFKEGKGFHLELIEIRELPTWLGLLILLCFAIGIIVVPLPYKVLILFMLLIIL